VATTVGSRGAPIEVLVVGWFPSADDLIAGRFIADQATALAQTGRVRPSVVNFEPFWLHGSWHVRLGAANAWPREVHRAVTSGLGFHEQGANAPAGIPVLRLGAPAGRTLLTRADNEAVHRASSLSAALAALPQRDWKLIHAHVGFPEGGAAAIVAEKRGLPFVLTEHATYLARLWADPIVRRRYRSAAMKARRFIAVSRVLADQIETEFPELRGRIVVIPNTVDVAAFRVVNPADRDPDELLWVGYRRAIKGMPTLLEAFRIVHDRRPSTTLRLIGRSPTDDEEAEWLRMARELGVEGAIRFDPPADRPAVVEAMARAACFVHPSSRETMGVVAAEALASGLPVVATDSGGVTEVLGSEPTTLGALVPRENPAGLAEAILATLERRMSFDPQQLRRSVEQRYGAPQVARRLADLYEEVLAETLVSRRRTPTIGASKAGGARDTQSPVDTIAAKPSAIANIILLAFDRPALDRALARFPAWVTRNTIIVSWGDAIPGFSNAELIAKQFGSSIMGLLTVPRRPAFSRGSPRDILLWPVRLLRRYRATRAREARIVPVMTAAIDRALDEAGARPGAPATIVCLGGIDIYLARRFSSSGRAIVAPGGLRWLGDQRSDTSPATQDSIVGAEPRANSP
jgi:glycosyltransferase involved in cell wall biosynthesis